MPSPREPCFSADRPPLPDTREDFAVVLVGEGFRGAGGQPRREVRVRREFSVILGKRGLDTVVTDGGGAPDRAPPWSPRTPGREPPNRSQGNR